MTPDEELRKERWMFYRQCGYCAGTEDLQLDAVKPFSWIPDSVWSWSDYDLQTLLINDAQVLCNPCLLRKKRLWKSYKKEDAEWFKKLMEREDQHG